MLDRDREREILREYEEALRRAQRDVATLGPIVENLRARVGESESELPDTRSRIPSMDPAATERRPRPTRPASPMETYRGRRTLMSAIRGLFPAPGNPRHVDDVLRVLRTDPDFADRVPTRNSVNSRLLDLAKTGFLTKTDRATFDRAAPQNGSVPTVETNEGAQAGPGPGVYRDASLDRANSGGGAGTEPLPPEPVSETELVKWRAEP
jgi:hypothetical protein